MKDIDRITQIVGQKFCSFGGGQENPYNPVSMALKDQPLQFAAGVDIKAVVIAVIDEAVIPIRGIPAEDRHGCKPDKVKPLAQYLGEYLATGINRTHGAGMPVDFTEDGLKPIFEQALDAYESTENVKIRIERV